MLSILCSWTAAKKPVGTDQLCSPASAAAGPETGPWLTGVKGQSLPIWIESPTTRPVGTAPVSTLPFTADKSMICWEIF